MFNMRRFFFGLVYDDFGDVFSDSKCKALVCSKFHFYIEKKNNTLMILENILLAGLRKFIFIFKTPL